MIRVPWRFGLRAVSASCVLVGLSMPVAHAAAATSFGGRATALQATVLGTTTVLSDTGPLPSSGGSLEASLLTASVPNVATANVLHATTIGQGDRTRSEASAADVTIGVAGQTVTADFLMARAMAQCTSSGAALSGSSDVARLVINGQPIVVSGTPNQTGALPGGRVLINEQSSSSNSITVTAVHVVIDGIADISISSAHAAISCPSVPKCTSNTDFVTGGGWITATPSASRATFAVAGGYKNGTPWGHLNYIDHGRSGPRVRGTGVTSYAETGPTTRHIEGTAEVNGQPGFTYQVDVADNGEPGSSDTFFLRVSNGYVAGGTLQGGNIQLHKPCR